MAKKVFGLGLLILIVLGVMAFLKNSQEEKHFVPTATDTSVFRIDQLTKETVVVPYVRKNKKLPDYYITKSEARQNGWVASTGNLCDVLPGKAIGGDVFSNREKGLPTARKRKWFEADLNYNCGRRNADRLLFSNDGLIYVTYDHYKTFQKK